MMAPWRRAGEVRHVFTHFELHLEVFHACVPVIEAEGFLRPVNRLDGEALPSVMRKAVSVVRGLAA
jgi:A/G-specific adenine glycosylase